MKLNQEELDESDRLDLLMGDEEAVVALFMGWALDTERGPPGGLPGMGDKLAEAIMLLGLSCMAAGRNRQKLGAPAKIPGDTLENLRTIGMLDEPEEAAE